MSVGFHVKYFTREFSPVICKFTSVNCYNIGPFSQQHDFVSGVRKNISGKK
jgi:hypothetical protein